MEKNWTCIYSTNTLYLAQMAIDLLGENDIDAVMINGKDSNYLFGTIDVYVERDNVLKGKRIIQNIEK